jgi:ubiquitin-conjugating enzyme E2 D/E
VRPTVERILNNIKQLFVDINQLQQKYGLRREDNLLDRPLTRQLRRVGLLRFQQRTSWTESAARITTKAKWVVVKKDRFEDLITHLKDFVDVLEDISNSLQQLTRRRDILEHDIETTQSERSLRILQEATTNSGVTISDTASSRFQLLEHGITARDDDMVFSAEQAGSLHETFITAVTHQEEESSPVNHLVSGEDEALDFSVDQGRSPVTREGPSDQRTVSGISGASRIVPLISNGLSILEIAAQTQKFFDIKANNSIRLSDVDADALSFAIFPPSTVRRLAMEFAKDSRDTITQVSYRCIEGRADDLLGVFLGPANSSYEGGIFYTRWKLPREYSLKPPTVKFLTKIFHPNIDSRGRICADFLTTGYTPFYRLESLLLSLLSLLDDPSVDDPLVPEIARQYIADRPEYDRIVRQYTKNYATGGMPEIEPLNLNSPWWRGMEVISPRSTRLLCVPRKKVSLMD